MAGKRPPGLPFGVVARLVSPLPLHLSPRPQGSYCPSYGLRGKTRGLEIGSQRGRNSHQIGVLGIYDLQGLNHGRTELLVAGMRLLEPDPSGTPRVGRCQ